MGKARGVQTPPPAAERGASGRAIAPGAAVPAAVRKSAGALRVLARGVKVGGGGALMAFRSAGRSSERSMCATERNAFEAPG